MEPKTESTPPAATTGNPFDRLSPTIRALIVTLLVTLVNVGIGYIWPKDAPTPPPTIPVPQASAPAVLVLNVGSTAQPAGPASPVAVGKP